MAFGTGTTLYIRIDRELQGHISADSLSCSIFKVPNHLRKINEMAYEPQVISIGPYHRGKDQLKAMEVHKKHYLKMLLNRMKENSVEKYLKALKGLKEKALKFYSEPPDLEDGGDQFVEMMLFDGCFVVELIRKSAMKELREENDHLLTHFILRTVMRDLLLIENQLPFFILMELFDLTKMPNEANQNFMHMAINCFSIMMPGPSNKTIENHPRIKHLLGLLHDSCLSPDYGGSSEEDEGSSEEGRLLPPPPLPLTPKPATSAPRVTFPPIKTPMLEKSLPSPPPKPPPPPPTAPLVTFPPVNTRPSAPLVTFPPDETRPSASLVTFAPMKIPMEETSLPSPSPLPPPPPPSAPLVCVPPSKTPEGVNSLPSLAILTNIHHSKMGAKLESLVPCESSIGAIEDNHHRHCSMKLNDALFSASRKSKEAISGTAKSEGHEEKNCNWQTIRSASELHEAGIKFEKKEGSMFDIKFEKGVMSIPTLKTVDDTESILRNLVAYEQCYKDISSRRFTDYIRFMDCLINTGKDVELLRRHEVIENRLGDNEVIADIFNRICDSVLIAEEEFFYADLFVRVHKHCKIKWNLWKANLWHNYFNTPWALISFIAAVFLLLLTAMQSIYSALAYHRQH